MPSVADVAADEAFLARPPPAAVVAPGAPGPVKGHMRGHWGDVESLGGVVWV